MNFALIGLVSLPALPFNLFSVLPFAAANTLAREVVLQSTEAPLSHVGIVLGNSLIYLVIGLSVFAVFEKLAKQSNLIGQY